MGFLAWDSLAGNEEKLCFCLSLSFSVSASLFSAILFLFPVSVPLPRACPWMQEGSFQGFQHRKNLKPPCLPCCPSFMSISWLPAPIICCRTYCSSFLFSLSHHMSQLLPLPLPHDTAISLLLSYIFRKICPTSLAHSPSCFPLL